jgi:DNA-binding response OmpR family regulator
MAAESEQTNKKATILLLASEPTVRAAVTDILEDAGYTVQAASDLGKAVDMLAAGPIDLLIISPFVAELSGREAANYLRAQNPGMKILMVAGLPDDDRIRNWPDIDHIQIFPEPFPAAQLVRKVDALLKKANG